MIDQRIAERRREVRADRQRRRLRRTIALVVLALLAAALFVIERSPLVALEEIEVVGTTRLSPDAVRDAADLPLGTSTLRLRLNHVADRVEALPLVREATARRVDPLTVRIDVVERTPALAATGEGTTLLVDRDGVVLAEGDAGGLPVIHLPAAPPEPGRRVTADAALHNAFQVWLGISGPLRADIVRYEAQGPEDLDLILGDDLTVRFGRAERIDEKVRALGVVLEDVAEERISLIDVRAPSAPVVAR